MQSTKFGFKTRKKFRNQGSDNILRANEMGITFLPTKNEWTSFDKLNYDKVSYDKDTGANSEMLEWSKPEKKTFGERMHLFHLSQQSASASQYAPSWPLSADKSRKCPVICNHSNITSPRRVLRCMGDGGSKKNFCKKIRQFRKRNSNLKSEHDKTKFREVQEKEFNSVAKIRNSRNRRYGRKWLLWRNRTGFL